MLVLLAFFLFFSTTNAVCSVDLTTCRNNFDYVYPSIDSTEVIVLGNYETFQPSQTVQVFIDRPGKNIILYIGGFVSNTWNITATPTTNISRIINMCGLNPNVYCPIIGGSYNIVLSSQKVGSYQWPVDFQFLFGWRGYIQATNDTGRSINAVSGCYATSNFRVCSTPFECMSKDYYLMWDKPSSISNQNYTWNFAPLANVANFTFEKRRDLNAAASPPTCTNPIFQVQLGNGTWITVYSGTSLPTLIDATVTYYKTMSATFPLSFPGSTIIGIRFRATSCTNMGEGGWNQAPVAFSLIRSTPVGCPITTGSASTSFLTSGSLTTSPVTTSPMTTSRVTSGDVTTSLLTTVQLTSGQVTTEAMTSSPVTSGEVSISVTESVASSSSNGEKSLVPVIAGSIGGGVVVLSAVILLAAVMNKRKKQTNPIRKSVESGTAYINSNDLQLQNTQYSSLPQHQVHQVPSPISKDTIKRISSSRSAIPIKEITLKEEVGKGAYGVGILFYLYSQVMYLVYKGIWRGSEVAVKMIHTNIQMNTNEVTEFEKEIDVMRELRPHKNVIIMFGYCSDPLSIITEFCSGGSLYTLIHSSKEISDETSFSYIKGMVAGMVHLHKEGIIHRDLATRNILLHNNEVKISDFGMSRISDNGNGNAQVTSQTVGPIRWMSPECLNQRIYSFKTDIYSFGILMYELLARKVPFENLDLMQVGIRVGTGQISIIDYMKGVHCSLILLEIMRKCVAFDPNQRPDFEVVLELLTK